MIEHNASFQQGAPVSAVDLLSDYAPATEMPTILANCGQQHVRQGAALTTFVPA